jgi:hypothetical protein
MTSLRISTITLLVWVCSGVSCIPITGLNSGIFGTILSGPQCPVQIEGDDQCADKPFAATVIVKTSNGLLEITRFTADSKGEFRVSLSPGTYLLDPLPGENGFPHSSPQPVTVEADTFTQVDISYDTGIR